MDADPRHRTGVIGEDAALARYLDAGYRLVARNWRCRLGELDLILQRGSTLVFCEVKARRGSSYGGGWEAVTARKQAKVRSVALAFLGADQLRPRAIRFDVASVVVGTGSGGPSVEIFEDAF